MVLATQPRLLLLDEPMAGMSSKESQRMVELLRELKGSHTLVLIEHDMDVVFALADTITVLVNGAVLETGSPAAVPGPGWVRPTYVFAGLTIATGPFGARLRIGMMISARSPSAANTTSGDLPNHLPSATKRSTQIGCPQPV